MKLGIKVQGVEKIMRDFSQKGLAAQYRADKVTETYTRKMANESGEMAPVKDNVLRPSIIASPRRVSNAVWEYGSDLPYARRQEYENASHKGFIRKSVWNNRGPYREALRREVTKK